MMTVLASALAAAGTAGMVAGIIMDDVGYGVSGAYCMVYFGMLWVDQFVKEVKRGY